MTKYKKQFKILFTNNFVKGELQMKNQKGSNSKRRVSIKWVILAVTAIPLLIEGIVITFFAGFTMNKGMQNEVMTGLRSAATGALLSLDNVSTESFCLVEDDLYKGDFNVTQNMASIDYYATSNDVEITFFYEDVRRATTIKNSNGERVVGTKADPQISETVLRQGQVYTTEDVIVNGESYFGFYMPVKDSSGNIIGMVFAGKLKAEIMSYIYAKINFIILFSVLTCVFCLILVTVVTKKRFIEQLNKLSLVAQKLSKGDINQEIECETNDEFGDLTRDFTVMIENIRKQAQIMEKVSEGDLTVELVPASKQDVMSNAIKKMVYDNNRNLSEIRNAAARMTSSSGEVASASNSLAQGATEQASAIQEITASINEIAEGAKINAKEADKANELAQCTKNDAEHSNIQMKDMIQAMQDIDAASQNISKIMKAIDDIAFQTNLLALNASVEAARAGVHGKGFAVVAEEVRNLARKSAEAAKNSNDIIEDSINKTKVGSRLAFETAEALEGILGSVENIAMIVGNIAEASDKQASSVERVNMGITQITDVVQTTSATSEQCAASSAELSNLARQLQEEVYKYRLEKN